MTWSPPGSQSAAITTPVCPVNSQTGVRRLGMPSDAATSSSYSSFSHTSTSSSEECPFFNTQYGDKQVKLPTACHDSVETGQNKLNSLLYVSEHSHVEGCWDEVPNVGNRWMNAVRFLLSLPAFNIPIHPHSTVLTHVCCYLYYRIRNIGFSSKLWLLSSSVQ